MSLTSRLMNKISNLMKIASVSNTGNDSESLPRSQFFYLDDAQECIAMYPYGMSANAPLNNFAMVFNMGQEEKTLALPFSGSDRIKNLKPGEVVVGNWNTGSFVKFNEDSTIDMTSSANINLTAPVVAVEGNLTVSGSITSGTTITAGTSILAGTTITATGALAGASIAAGGVTGSGGTLTASTDVLVGSISLASHTHGGVTVGAGSTGAPQ